VECNISHMNNGKKNKKGKVNKYYNLMANNTLF